MIDIILSDLTEIKKIIFINMHYDSIVKELHKIFHTERLNKLFLSGSHCRLKVNRYFIKLCRK